MKIPMLNDPEEMVSYHYINSTKKNSEILSLNSEIQKGGHQINTNYFPGTEHI